MKTSAALGHVEVFDRFRHNATANRATQTPVHSDDRLAQNALALVASSMITSLIGVVFWFAAARLFEKSEVGRGAALITAVTLLASLATLGLGNAFVRFIPVAGSLAGQFIMTAYLLCSIAAIVFASVFLLGIDVWADELSFVTDNPLSIIFFILGTAGWTLFSLQDSVLTGLRAATWIPAENALYSTAKLVALFLLAGSGAIGFGVAWVVPAVVTLGPVTWLVRRRLETAQFHAKRPTPLFNRRAIVRFAAGDQTADILRVIGAELVVLIVLAKHGASASASFFLASTIATSLGLFATNVANAFTAEAAARPREEQALLRRSLLHSGRLVVPAALITSLGAPRIMAVFGADYAREGGAVLRILAVGSLGQIFVALAIGVARLHRRMTLISVLFGSLAIGPVVGALVASPRSGLQPIAMWTVAGQLLVAAVVLATLLRPLWTSVAAGTALERMLQVRSRIDLRRRTTALASLLDELDSGREQRDRLLPRRIVALDTDAAVLCVDRPHAPLTVKVAFNTLAAARLRNEAEALDDIHRSGHQVLFALVPQLVEHGQRLGQDYLIATNCDGRAPLVSDHRTTVAAMEALQVIHQETIQQTYVDGVLLSVLVDAPICALASSHHLAPQRHLLEHLRRELRQSLDGRFVHTSRTHGDCWPGNFRFTFGSAGPQVCGIVDWENSQKRSLADIDLISYWLLSRPGGLARAVEQGLRAATVRDVLKPIDVRLFDPSLPADLVVLLAWLGHVASSCVRDGDAALSPAWLERNVTPVLTMVGSRVELFERI